ncbi:hypothetical protein AYO37_00625 [Opitutia bacterium SCGC AG-212-L18]|nr:hypothetical protein AYO37_00625 [Opitutae bacterium SCGC AG-212-L18]
MRSTQIKAVLYCLVIFLLLGGCKDHKHDHIQGYVDAQLTYISSTRSGKLISLPVDRGDEVKVGDLLFQLENEPEKAALELGKEKVKESQARLENAKKGQRPPELEAIEFKIAQAEARHDLAKITWERQVNLVKSKATAKSNEDAAKRELDESAELIKELKANLETAKLGARVDEIAAAEAQLQQAEADLERLEWEYNNKIVKSMKEARVFDTFFTIGETIESFKAVLSLLVPEEVKAIFFVPQLELHQLQVGQKIDIICDNCTTPITATVSFISPQAEYTPPVIYSTERRSELIFRVEAKFEKEVAKKMNLGLPIEVKLLK